MENMIPKTINECKKKWTYFDDDGQEKEFTEEEIKKYKPEWMAEDFSCDSNYKISRERAYEYYFYDYVEEKLKAYRQQFYNSPITNHTYSYWGLISMFNDGWVKSPAFVDWSDMEHGFSSILHPNHVRPFIMEIDDYQMRVDILSYFKKIYKSIVPYYEKELKPFLDSLLAESKEALRIKKEEVAASKKAQKRTKLPKEKPEYVVSLDEMLEYYSNEGDSLIAFINHCVVNKEDWLNKAVQNRIKKAQTAHHNTFNIGGNYNDIHNNTTSTIKS